MRPNLKDTISDLPRKFIVSQLGYKHPPPESASLLHHNSPRSRLGMDDQLRAVVPDPVGVVVDVLPGEPGGTLVVHIMELVTPLRAHTFKHCLTHSTRLPVLTYGEVGGVLVEVVWRGPHDVEVLTGPGYPEVCSPGTPVSG